MSPKRLFWRPIRVYAFIKFALSSFASFISVSPVPPKIINLSKDLVVNEGSNVSLMCQANGKPDPSISWKLISPSGKSTAEPRPQFISDIHAVSYKMSHFLLSNSPPYNVPRSSLSVYSPILDFVWPVVNFSLQLLPIITFSWIIITT